MEQVLAGVRVLDFTRALAGPYATMLLADLGAEVIKIEPPSSREDSHDQYSYKGMHFYFLSVNRNKKSLALDISAPAGRALFHDLVRVSDVVVDNFRPGVPERLGIDYASLSAINRRIICTSITGFGPVGPLRDRPAYDLCVQAMTGAVSLTGNPGERPVRNGIAVADQGAAFMAVAGTLAALYRREKTGLGERVETSLLESTIYQLAYEIALYTICGVVLKNIGSSHIAALPYGIYRTSDGWVAIAAPFKFDALCIALDRLDLAQDERFDSPGKIVKNRDVLEPELEAAFKQRSTAEWLRRLEEADVPCSPVNDIAQAIREPQVEATEMIVSVPHARGGDMRLVGSPIRFASSSAEMRQRYLPPPLLGQHTDEILTQVLGRQPQEIAELREAGVIG